MRKNPSVTLGAVLATAVVSSLLPLTSGAVANASPAALCQKVTPGEVSQVLGVKATKVTSDLNGNVTVCWYRVGANSQAVYVRSQSGDSLSGFNADKKAAAAQQEHPKVDVHFTPNPAFSTSIGSATYGYTYSVVVLKGHAELSVGAANVTLAKVEALTKKVLGQL